MPGERAALVLAAAALVGAVVAADGAVVAAPPDAAIGVPAAERLGAALRAFLGALDPAARREAVFAFDAESRQDWHYIPRFREGVPLGAFDAAQRARFDRLLDAGLSASGAARARGIVALEGLLREAERRSWRWPVHFLRSPDHYHVSVFGEPGAQGAPAGGAAPWGLRIEGHHLSLNYTVVGREVATGPLFMGANPHDVAGGPRAGWRVLGDEEDAARRLLALLDPGRLARAWVAPEAPDDIATRAAPAVAALEPVGVARAELAPAQREALDALVEVYLGRLPDGVAAARRAAIRASGRGAIHFAWMGALEPGAPHYYRVSGPTFLIEYDNVQNDANHSHTVWRELGGDFGRDLLAEHHRRAHAPRLAGARARGFGG